jgi:hypothetical protein
MPTLDLITGEEQTDNHGFMGALKKDPQVILSERLLDSYRSSAETWRQRAKEDDDFRNGAQWTPAQKKKIRQRKQTPLVVNVLKPMVEMGKSLLTARRPQFSTTAREDSDVRTGRMFADILSFIWDRNQGSMLHKIIIDDYYVKSMGYWFAYHDPQKDFGTGDICLASLDPLEVFVDPNSRDFFFRDAAHLIISRLITGEQLQQYIPNVIDELKNAETSDDTMMPSQIREGDEGQTDDPLFGDREHVRYRAIDRYTKIKVNYAHAFCEYNGDERIMLPEEFKRWLASPAVVETGEQGERYITKEDEVVEALRVFKETGGVFHYTLEQSTGNPVMVAGAEDDDAIPGSEVRQQVVTIKDLVEAGIIVVNEFWNTRILRHFSVGGKLLYKQVLPISEYPIIPVPNHWRRNPYPMSDVSMAKGMQEYINKIRSLIMAHAANAANVKVFIPNGAANRAEVEELLQRPGAGAIYYDAELGTVTIAQPIPLPSELYKNEADAKKDIENIFGIYQFMGGDPTGSPDTYRGTVALDEMGQRKIRSKVEDIEGSLNQLARVLIEMVQAYYTEHKIIRILEPNNKPRELQINVPIYDELGDVVEKINDVTVGQYDVVVVTGSMLPSNRWARFEYYMRLYEARLIDQIEVLKQTEVVDIEGVMNRFSEIARLRQALEQMDAKIKELSGDLQTAERESLHDRKRLEVEKFKSSLKELSAQASAALKIYSSRLGDSLQQQRAVADESTNSQ